MFIPSIARPKPQRRSSVSDLTYNAILHYICNKNDMKPLSTEGYAGQYFTTATIKGWKHLLTGQV